MKTYSTSHVIVKNQEHVSCQSTISARTNLNAKTRLSFTSTNIESSGASTSREVSDLSSPFLERWISHISLQQYRIQICSTRNLDPCEVGVNSTSYQFMPCRLLKQVWNLRGKLRRKCTEKSCDSESAFLLSQSSRDSTTAENTGNIVQKIEEYYNMKKYEKLMSYRTETSNRKNAPGCRPTSLRHKC